MDCNDVIIMRHLQAQNDAYKYIKDRDFFLMTFLKFIYSHIFSDASPWAYFDFNYEQI